MRSASDALLQSIELAVAAEELGADGAYFRVHHFARQLGSPFPLLAAVGARTSRIEIGTAVIDMRYENPLYMAEDAGAADLIAGGRLQLGISRGSPEQVIDGCRYFGYAPAEGETDADMARRHAEVFLEVLEGEGFAQPNPRPMFPNPPGLLRLEPHSPGLRDRIWWGAATDATAVWAARAGHEPAELDAQVRRERRAAPRPAAQADRGLPGGVEGGRPRARAARLGQPQHLRPRRRPRSRVLRARRRRTATRSATSTRRPAAIFGRSYAAEPDVLVKQLAEDDGDRRRRHAAADRPQPARRRLQRPRHRERSCATSRRSSAGADASGLVEPSAQPQDVAVRVVEPGAPGRAERGDVAGGLERAFGVVDEVDAACFEVAHDAFDVGHLEMGERVVGGTRSAAEDRELRSAASIEAGRTPGSPRAP